MPPADLIQRVIHERGAATFIENFCTGGRKKIELLAVVLADDLLC